VDEVRGTRRLGLWGATAGFFFGFAAVALFGPTAKGFAAAMGLGPVAMGLLVAAPALSGSLLRIPFSAWVDTTGGRTPFLVLLGLAAVGMAGLAAVVHFFYPDRLTPAMFPLVLLLGVLAGCGIATFSVGIAQVAYWFPQSQQGRALAVFAGVGNLAPGLFSLLLPVALEILGLTRAYVAWLVFLLCGAALYWALGRNAPYFQLRARGLDAAEARRRAAGLGEELFPGGRLVDSLRLSARAWQTWALVLTYFTTFGGFIALTAWLPTYWGSFFACSAVTAGALTAVYSLLTSAIRIAGGVMADRLREGGENTAVLGLLITLVGALVMASARELELALPGLLLLAFGMGICNAAVFKIVPQAVPAAVGGAAGWIGGLGAFGGFVIPALLAFAVDDLGQRGYAIGFIVFVFLALASLAAVWILKYAGAPGPAAVDPATAGRRSGGGNG